MTLRHIKPRSVEWYDALLDEDWRSTERLAPDEMQRLRQILAAEQALGMPPPDELLRVRTSRPVLHAR